MFCSHRANARNARSAASSALCVSLMSASDEDANAAFVATTRSIAPSAPRDLRTETSHGGDARFSKNEKHADASRARLERVPSSSSAHAVSIRAPAPAHRNATCRTASAAPSRAKRACGEHQKRREETPSASFLCSKSVARSAPTRDESSSSSTPSCRFSCPTVRSASRSAPNPSSSSSSSSSSAAPKKPRRPSSTASATARASSGQRGAVTKTHPSAPARKTRDAPERFAPGFDPGSSASPATKRRERASRSGNDQGSAEDGPSSDNSGASSGVGFGFGFFFSRARVVSSTSKKSSSSPRVAAATTSPRSTKVRSPAGPSFCFFSPSSFSSSSSSFLSSTRNVPCGRTTRVVAFETSARRLAKEISSRKNGACLVLVSANATSASVSRDATDPGSNPGANRSRSSEERSETAPRRLRLLRVASASNASTHRSAFVTTPLRSSKKNFSRGVPSSSRASDFFFSAETTASCSSTNASATSARHVAASVCRGTQSACARMASTSASTTPWSSAQPHRARRRRGLGASASRGARSRAKISAVPTLAASASDRAPRSLAAAATSAAASRGTRDSPRLERAPLVASRGIGRRRPLRRALGTRALREGERCRLENVCQDDLARPLTTGERVAGQIDEEHEEIDEAAAARACTPVLGGTRLHSTTRRER